MLAASSLRAIASRREETGAACVLLTAIVPDADGYGRIVRDDWGRITQVIEHADATDAELEITEVNSSVYAFDAATLRLALAELTAHNAQGEQYLPDVVRIMVKNGDPVEAVVVHDWREIAGVNDRVQLAQARALLRDRIVTSLMRDGVTVIDPATTWVDVGVVARARLRRVAEHDAAREDQNRDGRANRTELLPDRHGGRGGCGGS